MKCNRCGAEMAIRSGRYGDFYFCPKSTKDSPHKTVSAEDSEKSLILSLSQQLSTTRLHTLDELIQKGLYEFGLPSDRLTELAQFSIIDDLDY